MKPASNTAFPITSAPASSPFSSSAKKDAVNESVKSADQTSSFLTKQASGGASFPSTSAAESFTLSLVPKKEDDTGTRSSNAAHEYTPIASGVNNLVVSVYEAEFWKMVKRFADEISMAKSLQAEANECIPQDLEADIEKMVNNFEEKSSNTRMFLDQNRGLQERLIHLLSVQDDLDRQKKESTRAIEELTTQQTSSNLARKEPLDVESEKMRRNITSKCHGVQNLIAIVEGRLALNKEIFSCSANRRQETVRASDYFNEWSRTKPIGHRQTTRGATNALFVSLTTGYDKVREFDQFVQQISEKSAKLSISHEGARQIHHSGVKQIKPKNRLGSSSITSPLPTTRSKLLNARQSILERQKSLRQMTSEFSHGARSSSIKTFYLRPLTTRDTPTHAQIPDWRSRGRNELFSASKEDKTNIVPKSLMSSPALAKTLFLSPPAGVKVRKDWYAQTDIVHAELKVNMPQKLKYVDSAEAAKDALGKSTVFPSRYLLLIQLFSYLCYSQIRNEPGEACAGKRNNFS